jgi:flagellar motor switch protein FliN
MISSETVERCAEVPIEVAAEIGRTSLTVQEILYLEPNSLIRLPRVASEKVDVLIGGAHVGQGEIVITGNSVALRIGAFREEA